MMADKAYRAIVIIGNIAMMMEHCHECGSQEKQNEKNGKTFEPKHDVPFRDEYRLIIADGFVKTIQEIVSGHD